MWRIRFDIKVDYQARTKCMLLPASDLWEPSTAEDRDRLRCVISTSDGERSCFGSFHHCERPRRDRRPRM